MSFAAADPIFQHMPKPWVYRDWIEELQTSSSNEHARTILGNAAGVLNDADWKGISDLLPARPAEVEWFVADALLTAVMRYIEIKRHNFTARLSNKQKAQLANLHQALKRASELCDGLPKVYLRGWPSDSEQVDKRPPLSAVLTAAAETINADLKRLEGRPKPTQKKRRAQVLVGTADLNLVLIR